MGQTCWTGFLPLPGDENIVFEAKDSPIVTLFTPWSVEADLVQFVEVGRLATD
jgi:hypothetical protein